MALVHGRRAGGWCGQGSLTAILGDHDAGMTEQCDAGYRRRGTGELAGKLPRGLGQALLEYRRSEDDCGGRLDRIDDRQAQ
jgi:hypothetical protein